MKLNPCLQINKSIWETFFKKRADPIWLSPLHCELNKFAFGLILLASALFIKTGIIFAINH
jgi:hypothetical protein